MGPPKGLPKTEAMKKKKNLCYLHRRAARSNKKTPEARSPILENRCCTSALPLGKWKFPPISSLWFVREIPARFAELPPYLTGDAVLFQPMGTNQKPRRCSQSCGTWSSSRIVSAGNCIAPWNPPPTNLSPHRSPALIL